VHSCDAGLQARKIAAWWSHRRYFTIQSEHAADCFEALHLQVQLQEQPLKTVCGKLLSGGPTEDYTIKSEPAADCFEALHLQVQLQEQPLKIAWGKLTTDGRPCLKIHAREIGAHLQSGLPTVFYEMRKCTSCINQMQNPLTKCSHMPGS